MDIVKVLELRLSIFPAQRNDFLKEMWSAALTAVLAETSQRKEYAQWLAMVL